MELKGIKEFLERYKKKIEYQDDLRDLVRATIMEICEVNLLDKEFSLTKGEVILNINAVKKSHIHIHKRLIIDELSKRGIAIHDIH
jgi:hypothetical protein